jgi:hypothetical protein
LEKTRPFGPEKSFFIIMDSCGLGLPSFPLKKKENEGKLSLALA